MSFTITWYFQIIIIIFINFSICFCLVKSFSPCNYQWQKAIAFNIAIEEKIIDSKFLPLIIYLQFAMNISLFCWIKSFFHTNVYSFKKNCSPDYFTWSTSFPFIYTSTHYDRASNIANFSLETMLQAWCPGYCKYRPLLCPV